MKMHSWKVTELLKKYGPITTGEATKHLELELSNSGEYVCRLWLNDSLLDIESEQDVDALPLAQFQTLRVQTSLQQELIENTVNSLSQNVSELDGHAKKIVHLFSDQKYDEAWDSYDGLLERLQDFFEAMGYLRPLLNQEAQTIAEDWDKAELHFKGLIDQLMEALYQKEAARIPKIISTKMHYALSLLRHLFVQCQNEMSLKTGVPQS
jgi:hypothetical protein